MFFGRDISGQSRPAINRILVVEDEALVAFDNENFLVHAGYTVVGTVDSYEAAVALIKTEDVDLVVADINLSGDRNGIEVADVARAREIPVLFVTGSCPVNAQDVAVGCLGKPYSERDLLAAIKAIDALIQGKRLPRLPNGLKLFSNASEAGPAAA